VPKVKRHPKVHPRQQLARHRRGKRVIAFSAPRACTAFDRTASRFGRKISAFSIPGSSSRPDAQWDIASSTVLFEDKVIVQADVQKNSFLAALDATTGEQLWRTPRNDVPTWSTPTVQRYRRANADPPQRVQGDRRLQPRRPASACG
jgi:hypothetical protein